MSPFGAMAVSVGLKKYWAGTIFSVDLSIAAKDNSLPKSGDLFQIDFKRPFTSEDYFEFKINPEIDLNTDKVKEDMNKIKVVPNPYVMTNSLEGAVANYQLNQKRQIMFTNIPAQSTIKIFTTSGVLVEEIDVNNSISSRIKSWDTNSSLNGTAFWDLKSREGLDIAPGYYIYQVKSKLTGDEKVGKFAVIK